MGSWRARLQADAIVRCIAKALFASQVTLCGLHRNVTKQELDLLQFASSFVAHRVGIAPFPAFSPVLEFSNYLDSFFIP
jgi:hypothetical protein